MPPPPQITPPISPRRKWLRRAFLLLLAMGLIWIAGSFFIAYRLTHRATAPYAEALPTFPGTAVTQLQLTTSDAQTIAAWWVPAPAAEPDSAPVILLLHGNGADRSSLVPQARFLLELNCNVMLIALRAHGPSTGDTNDFGLSARHDVIAAVHQIRQLKPHSKIIIYGQSLGAAAALFASQDLTSQVDGYILESVYPDLWTAVRHRTRIYLPTPLAQTLDAGLWLSSLALLPNASDISPLQAARNIPANTPVLLIASQNDTRATVDEQQTIAAKIPGPTQVVVFPGAGHLQAMQSDPTRMRQVILDFIEKQTANTLPGKVDHQPPAQADTQNAQNPPPQNHRHPPPP